MLGVAVQAEVSGLIKVVSKFTEERRLVISSPAINVGWINGTLRSAALRSISPFV
jgi:hypothetical protein